MSSLAVLSRSSFSSPLFFQSSSLNAVRATLFCKYALTYHSRARSGKLNFQLIAFHVSQKPFRTRRDAAETMNAQFVVPPLGGSVRRNGMDLRQTLPPKGGTTN